MKKNGSILITGGFGFIGSTVVKRFFKVFPKHKIVVMDSMTYAGNIENLPPRILDNPRFLFVKSDICDRTIVGRAIESSDIIVHLAAESHVDSSLLQADDFILSNVFGTMVLCEEAVKYPVKLFVLVSSSEAYGNAEKTPMGETHALNPRSPYAASKVGSEKVAMSYYYSYGLPLVVLRPFNNYGPHQHAEKVIPRFITNLLNNNKIILHNQGRQTRDWVYVEDTARAVESAVRAPIERISGEIINIGTGKETSIGDIARFIVDELDMAETAITSGGDRPGQVMRHLAGVEKAKRLLGWESEIAIEDGLSRTIDWYAQNISWWRELHISAANGSVPLN